MPKGTSRRLGQLVDDAPPECREVQWNLASAAVRTGLSPTESEKTPKSELVGSIQEACDLPKRGRDSLAVAATPRSMSDLEVAGRHFEPSGDQDGSTQSGQHDVVHLKTLDDLFDLPDPSYNVDGIFQQGTIANVFGLPGAGKTTLIVSAACCVATGRPWFNRRVEKGLVVVIPLEDYSGLRARFAAWLEDHPGQRPNLARNFRFTDAIQEYEDLPKLVEPIKVLEQETGMPLRLLILDPILAAFGAEFSASDERDFRNRLGHFQSVLAPFPLATGVAVTHCGWSGEHELGSIVQRALSATAIKVTQAAGAVRVDVVRQKNARDRWGMDFTLDAEDGLPKLRYAGEGRMKAGKRRTLADEAYEIIQDLCSESRSGDVLGTEARQAFLDAQPQGKAQDTGVRGWSRAIRTLKDRKLIRLHRGRIRATHSKDE